MKVQVLQIAIEPHRSFSFRNEMIPNVNSQWHCHPEVELIYFRRGSGTQFIGDSVHRFLAGDVILLGANIPHYWQFDIEEIDGNQENYTPFSTVIHFNEKFWGEQFLSLSENAVLKNTLEKARYGLAIGGESGRVIASLMERLLTAEGPYRVIILIECLIAASKIDNNSILTSPGFFYENPDLKSQRINSVYKYTHSHFYEKISLDKIASLVGLAPSSFCRYFKSCTGKHYFQFLTEIRIGYACKMLVNNTMSIKQICYDSGFNNLTCFYKKFKQITGKTPVLYQQAFSSNSRSS